MIKEIKSTLTLNMNTFRGGSITSIIHNSRKVLTSQLEYRGYDVSQYNNCDMTEVDMLIEKEQLDILVSNEGGKKCFVKYFLDRALREGHIHDLVDELIQNENILETTDDIIIVSKSPANQTIQKTVKYLFDSKGIFVSIYPIMCLQYNVLEHDLVPKHEVVTNKEKVFRTFNIKDNSHVPEISRFDAVALAIGLRPTELCKIYRKSKTAIESEYYRICV